MSASKIENMLAMCAAAMGSLAASNTFPQHSQLLAALGTALGAILHMMPSKPAAS